MGTLSRYSDVLCSSPSPLLPPLDPVCHPAASPHRQTRLSALLDYGVCAWAWREGMHASDIAYHPALCTPHKGSGQVLIKRLGSVARADERECG
jgi:hypothetical protein